MGRIDRRNSLGFSILELSIALLIFLIGSLGLLQMITVSANLNQKSRDTTLATSLAQAKADELLHFDFDDPKLSRGGYIPLNPSTNPLVAPNPAPVSGYADFFNYSGNGYSPAVIPVGTPLPVPSDTYFVRQWQIWSCCDAGAKSCTASCAPPSGSNNFKMITVTVTSLSPTVDRHFTSVTVIVYKSRIG